MNRSSSHPIGIFDSGVGGLTVMRQIADILPNEQLIYFGDTARVPYGNKSPQTIIRYSIENTLFLLKKKIKLLVIACNTASAYALPKLRELFDIPIIEVIQAGSHAAAEKTRNQRIGVLGTRGTIQSEAYQKALQNLLPEALIVPIACPLFVPFVEEQWLHHDSTRLVVKEYLRPIKENGIDTLLLGCTHYPLIAHLIQEEVGDEVTLVDSASTCAAEVASFLEKSQQLSSARDPLQHEYHVSDDPERFCTLAEKLFGHSAISVFSQR